MNHICLIGNNSGGLYLFRRELIEALSADENSVTVLTPFDSHVSDLQALGVELIETPLDRRGLDPLKDLGLLRQYLRILRENKPELVITYTIKPNIYAGLACRLLGIPFAANITGLGTAFQKRGMLQTLVTLLYRLTVRHARVVFFENEENRDILVAKKIVSPGKTHVLHGAGVNLAHYTPVPYPQEEPIRFLFMGRVMREKGVDELLEAMRLLRGSGLACTLDVLGFCEEDYMPQLQPGIEAGWLRFLGFQEDVRPFIAASHCFVLPSWHEGMANTNLECAAMARPVITSRIHGCLEAVEDGVSGYLCEKQNADDLYRVMKRFAALSPEDREAMGLAGRKRMEALFDKEKVVAETIGALFLQ